MTMMAINMEKVNKTKETVNPLISHKNILE